jgi:CheY-like chemotaxis protein
VRVLVADDSTVVRSTVAALLGAHGYEVELAADGAEAISSLLTRPPDAVLVDLHMPRVTGWVVCRLIKEDPALCRIPVLVLTAYSGPEDRFWAEQSGADAYLAKDSIGDTLLDRLQSAVAGRALAELNGPVCAAGTEGPVDVLARVCEVLDRKLFEATLVNEITSVALRALDLRAALAGVLTAVGRALAFDMAAVALLSERTAVRRVNGLVSPDAAGAFDDMVAEALSELSAADLTARDLAFTGGSEDLLAGDGAFRGWGSRLVVPLQARGRVIGVLLVAAGPEERFDETSERTLRAVTPAVALVVEGAREFSRVMADEVGAGLSSL